jgi:hypothetical protein
MRRTKEEKEGRYLLLYVQWKPSSHHLVLLFFAHQGGGGGGGRRILVGDRP